MFSNASEFTFTCGFNATVTTTPIMIYSPRYPETYPNGANCVWNLMASVPGGTIMIEFHDLDIEENFDVLVVSCKQLLWLVSVNQTH